MEDKDYEQICMGLKTNNRHYSALLPKLKEKSHIGVKKDIYTQGKNEYIIFYPKTVQKLGVKMNIVISKAGQIRMSMVVY